MTVVDLEPLLPAKCTQAQAQVMAARVMAAAGDQAKQDAVFLMLVGDFDAAEAVRYWDGLQSTAHWLSWSCSIAPSTAREHVRVARALRRMPIVAAAFAAGELTYSKVRELTRLVDDIADDRHEDGAPKGNHDTEVEPTEAVPDTDDPFVSDEPLTEERVIGFSRACTASQLARSVSGYRAADGTTQKRRTKQRVTYVTDVDGNIRLTAVLPPEIGAAMIAALDAAVDANADPQAEDGDACADDRLPGQSADDVRKAAHDRTRVEALGEIADHYLASRPEDRSGEDRTMVVFEINASALGDGTPTDAADPEGAHSPADITDATGRSGPAVEQPSGVPAGTPWLKCRVRRGPAVDEAAASTALCDSPIVGAIISDLGEPLAVGQAQRFVTRAQRRALMIRDGCCQYPGCTRIRRLKAHHRRSWASGGPTELQNLILLCQRHHTRVHEDHITITACSQPTCTVRWRFTRPDGTTITPAVAGLTPLRPWRIDDQDQLSTPPDRLLARSRPGESATDFRSRQALLRERAEQLRSKYAHVDHTDHPDACLVFPVGGGAGFFLNECVDALFRMTDRDKTPAA